MKTGPDVIPAVEVHDLAFSYGKVPVLESANLMIESGEFVSIVGPNGGGKTTLLKLLLGVLRPTRGSVRIFGKSPVSMRDRMGYTPQHALYDPKFPVTVLDVVLMGRLEKHFGGRYSAQDKALALQALEEMQLADVAQRSFGALSGGQRQRVLVARALVTEPKMLLLDEPTANMDAVVGDQLLEVLKRLHQRMTIVLVSHDLGFVSNIVQRVICVNKQVYIHPTSDVTGEVIKDLYGGDYRMIRHDHRCSEGGHTHV